MNTVKTIDVQTKKEKNLYLVMFLIGLFFVSLFFIWWFQPSHIPNNFIGIDHILDFILFNLVSYVVWYQIITELFSWYVVFFMKAPKPLRPEINKKVAFLTAFVPGAEPYDMLEKTLKAMVAADYPHDTWLLDEGNDIQAKKICKKYGVKYFTRKGDEFYNTPQGPFKAKTKGGNYNAWFWQHGFWYDYVAQLDVDFVPRKNFLTKTLGYFRDPEVAFVGTPQIYGNVTDSWIVKGAAEQAYNFYGPLQKGFFGQHMTLFIGANHVVRVSAHDSIGEYSGHIVEDHLTGMRLYTKKWKSVYVPEILAIGEGPATWDAYFAQQMRWAYGLIHILMTESLTLFTQMKKTHIFNYLILQQYYFYGLAQFIGIFLLILYFAFGITITPMELKPLLIFYVPLLLWQQVMFIFSQRYNIDPKSETGLMIRAKVLNWAAWPIYFLALVGVFLRKRLSYKVTPKGDNKTLDAQPGLFIPHLVLGSMTLICLLFAVAYHRTAPLLLFWAVINTVVMYYYFFSEFAKKLSLGLRELLGKINLFRPIWS